MTTLRYFDTRIASGEFPISTGVNNFPPDGKGIWRMMMQTENGTIRIHDKDELTLSRGILTPIIQCCVDNPGDPVLLFNLYSETLRRETLDSIIQCSDFMRLPGQVKYPDESCWSITDFLTIVRFNQKQASSSIMFTPIYPSDTQFEVRGFILSPIVWDEIFVSVYIFIPTFTLLPPPYILSFRMASFQRI